MRYNYLVVAAPEGSTPLITNRALGHDPEPLPSSQRISLRFILMLSSDLPLGILYGH